MDQALTFTDILNKSLLSIATGTAEKITPIDIVINISLSFAIGLFIFFIYKKTFQGVLYQKSFNIALVVVCSVTSLIIMTISGNLVLSLGMVGALSIVRFRTPIKDSIDLAFLFWAISVGIANGVGYYNISIIGSVLISLILLFLTYKKEQEHPYLLVIQLVPDSDETKILDIVKKQTRLAFIKSKVVTDSHVELIVEVRLHKEKVDFVNQLQEMDAAIKTTLISYNGDYAAL